METDTSPSQHLTMESPSSALPAAAPSLDLTGIPPIAIISTHFKDSEEKQLKDILTRYHAPLAADVSRASVFIGKVGTKRRAEFELRSRKFKIEEIVEPKRAASPLKDVFPEAKRRRLSGSHAGVPLAQGDRTNPVEILDDSETEVEGESETENEEAPQKQDTPVALTVQQEEEPVALRPTFEISPGEDIIWVIRFNWIEECVAADRMIPLKDYLVLKAKAIERPAPLKTTPKSIKAIFGVAAAKTASQTQVATRPPTAHEILDRAKSDASSAPKAIYQHNRASGHGSRRFEGRTFASGAQGSSHATHLYNPARLLEQTTSDYEGDDSELPTPPEWVKKGLLYACQRLTPANGPNQDFIDQLKKIRTARTLIDDQIGVRAYSTIIASIAAYPHELSHPRELLQLPGCDEKTAVLFIEWKNTGKIQAVEDYENDEAMKVLRLFYDIWGVGAKTARQFYYNNHWAELDDIIEFGWNELDRVQQIGVKYYDEFLVPIPRAEVEQIASIVRQHAIRLRDERITVTIVGGYRRGKEASGDVDMIVSHPDLEVTAGLIREIVEALEDSEWITHTLTMSLHNTNRGQNTLPFRSNRGTGVGFDTLDKALVVWQNPSWPMREQDLAENPRAKNPNIHRRVDIIVAPWRTVGCAVTGWSGGTTFQRDLRRYAKKVKGWKFDSSGIRSRSHGEVVQVEGPNGVDGTPEDAERKVFEGLGLEYIPPEFRCTN